MEAIFEIFVNLFFTIWNGIGDMFEPIINLVGTYAPKIVGFVIDILSFVIDVLMSLIEGVIDFLDFKWLKDIFKRKYPGYGSGGGGMGIR